MHSSKKVYVSTRAVKIRCILTDPSYFPGTMAGGVLKHAN